MKTLILNLPLNDNKQIFNNRVIIIKLSAHWLAIRRRRNCRHVFIYEIFTFVNKIRYLRTFN